MYAADAHLQLQASEVAAQLSRVESKQRVRNSRGRSRLRVVSQRAAKKQVLLIQRLDKGGEGGGDRPREARPPLKLKTAKIAPPRVTNPKKSTLPSIHMQESAHEVYEVHLI